MLTYCPDLLVSGGCDSGSLFGSCTFWSVVRVWDGEGVGTVRPLDNKILVDLDM